MWEGKTMRHRIKSAADAKKAIGKCVHWVERSKPRGLGLQWETSHSGVLTESRGKNLLINGDWKWRLDLTELEYDDGKEPAK